jgi:hypothetical protein
MAWLEPVVSNVRAGGAYPGDCGMTKPLTQWGELPMQAVT